MEKLIYTKQDGIAYLTLDRAEALNALDDALNEELATAWEDFDADPDIDVAILTGAGRAFCAGADLKSFIPAWQDATLFEARRNAAQGIGGGLTRGRKVGKPVIAAINGYAIGGGFELALACDIRIAADNASFGVFEVRHGMHQGDGGLVRLVAIAGLGVALDLTLSGREVPADEALRLGLVSRVVPAAELLPTAEKYAQMIRANGRAAVRSAKETALDVIGRRLDDALRLEMLSGYSLAGSPEGRERLARFVDR